MSSPTLEPTLAERAHQRRQVLASVDAGHHAFLAALSIGCPRHQANPGQACWDLTGDQQHRAVCQHRQRRARDYQQRQQQDGQR